MAAPTPLPYFDAVRHHYLAVLRRGIDEAVARGGRVVVEAAARTGGALPFRHDLVSIDDRGGVHPMMPIGDHAIDWEPAAYVFGGRLRARVQHLVWNVCVIIARPVPSPAARELVRAWYLRWFEAVSDHDAPFSGVVHFMAEPDVSATGEYYRVKVDLGSAPSDALVELLEVLARAGCTDGIVYTPDDE
jgi:hypothetical protein